MVKHHLIDAGPISLTPKLEGPTTLPKQSSNIAKTSLSNRGSRACRHVLAARGKDSEQHLLPWPVPFPGHRAWQGLQGPGPATPSPPPPVTSLWEGAILQATPAGPIPLNTGVHNVSPRSTQGVPKPLAKVSRAVVTVPQVSSQQIAHDP